jgi:hypothetical protein
METYLNRNGNSGVEAYKIGNNCIEVKFKGTAKIYKYSYLRAGQLHVENMKALALRGSGLNGYIKTYVNNLFDK